MQLERNLWINKASVYRNFITHIPILPVKLEVHVILLPFGNSVDRDQLTFSVILRAASIFQNSDAIKMNSIKLKVRNTGPIKTIASAEYK